MRTSTISICAVVALVAGSLCSATYADPLAPGKPAGVRAAQMGNTEWLVFGGLGIAAAAFLIAGAGSGHDAVPAQAVTITGATTTTS